MKAQWRDWPSMMKAPLKSFYWISSDDPLLKEEALDALRDAAKSQGFDREIIALNNLNDWQHFESVRQNLSLFNPKPLYECHLSESKFKDGIQSHLHQCAQTIAGNACIVIVTPKLESATQKTKWFEALLPHTVWLPLWPLEGEAFQQHVSLLARQSQLQFTPDAWKLFLSHCPDLLSAKQTMMRLASLPLGVIDAERLQDHLPNVVPCEVFDLTDALLEGDASRAILLLHQLNAQSDINVLILWAITKDIDTLIDLQSQQNPHILPKRKHLFMQAMRRFSSDELLSLMAQCARCDRALKGGQEHWMAADLVSNLCVTFATGKPAIQA